MNAPGSPEAVCIEFHGLLHGAGWDWKSAQVRKKILVTPLDIG